MSEQTSASKHARCKGCGKHFTYDRRVLYLNCECGVGRFQTVRPHRFDNDGRQVWKNKHHHQFILNDETGYFERLPINTIWERLYKYIFYSPDGCWYWTSIVS